MAADGRWRTAVTWAVRVAVGCTFVFSGLAKAIDPWGTIYKINAYLSVWDLPVWESLTTAAAFALSGIEFLIGICLLTGTLRRTASYAAAAVMAFMLPLSLWLAITDPVPDCGCFGDALRISNWATFFKNIVLAAGVVWLVMNNRRCRWLITPALQWIMIVATSAFILVVEFVGYSIQPTIDFRPYPVGATLMPADEGEEGEEYIFVYEKNGVTREFSIDSELPADSTGWIFVDRRLRKAGAMHPDDKRTMRVWSEPSPEGGDADDVTDETLGAPGKLMILAMAEIEKVTPAVTWKINSLHDWCAENGITMFAIASGSEHDIEEWRDLAMAGYPVYTADDTQLKELVRGNPGLVYAEDGMIKWKRSLYSIDTDDFMAQAAGTVAADYAPDLKGWLVRLSAVYASVLAVLICLTFMHALARMTRKRTKAITHDDKARP